jgi:hypothetical protein
MCSSDFSGKEQSLTVPRVLLWLTSFVHRDVACWMWCSRLRVSCRLWLPFIASLHYINPPKLAISHQYELEKSCLNNKGAEYYCLSLCWILQSIRWSVIKWHRFADYPALSSHEWILRVKVAPANRTCGEVGGMAWVALWRAFLKQYSLIYCPFNALLYLNVCDSWKPTDPYSKYFFGISLQTVPLKL